MKMEYCPACGSRLRIKEHPTDVPTLFCETCGDYRFPIFSTAISAIVLDGTEEHMLLITQYGEKEHVFVAGYVDKGETAEDAVRREVREELGMTVRELRFNRSRFYEPSETLMLNYIVTVRETVAVPNWEVDSWIWVPVREAGKLLKTGGLAEQLLEDFFKMQSETEEV